MYNRNVFPTGIQLNDAVTALVAFENEFGEFRYASYPVPLDGTITVEGVSYSRVNASDGSGPVTVPREISGIFGAISTVDLPLYRPTPS